MGRSLGGSNRGRSRPVETQAAQDGKGCLLRGQLCWSYSVIEDLWALCQCSTFQIELVGFCD